MSYSAVLKPDEVLKFIATLQGLEVSKHIFVKIYYSEEDIDYILELHPKSFASKSLDEAFENKLKDWNEKFTEIVYEYPGAVGEVSEVGDEDADPNWLPMT